MHFKCCILLAILHTLISVFSAPTGVLGGALGRPASVEPYSPRTLEMEKNLPVFTIPLKWFTFPTLIGFNKAGAAYTRKSIYEYATSYAVLLLKHFTSETEVTINSGVLTPESETILSKLETEFDYLQYRNCLENIITPWLNALVGQPLSEKVLKLIIGFKDRLLALFEKFRIKVQTVATRTMRSKNNLLCANVCKSENRILNLTKSKVPVELRANAIKWNKLCPA